jgi:hypothetical protein
VKHGRTRPPGSGVSSLAAVACALLASAWAGLGLAACAPPGDKQWGEACRAWGLNDDDCVSLRGETLSCSQIACGPDDPGQFRCRKFPVEQPEGVDRCEDADAVCVPFSWGTRPMSCVPASVCNRPPQPDCTRPPDEGETTAATDTAAGTGGETTAETTTDTTAASIPETTAPVLPSPQPPAAEALVSSAGSAITP